MLFTNLRRIVQSGFVSFWRNSFVSLSSLLIMVITIFVIGLLIFVSTLLSQTLENVRQRVDINVYLVREASEEDIRALQRKLEALPEVESVAYVSREQALLDFRAAQPEFNEAFDILNENPLNASLNILATDTLRYEDIQAFLESDAALTADGRNIVEYSNFHNHRPIIEGLTSIIETTRRVGIYAAALLFALSIIITFNTIRLAIHTSREEIAVMRLVGASNAYIQGPFMVSGVIGGIFAGLIVLMLFYPLTFWIDPAAQNFFGNINLFDYYVENFLQLFIIFLGTGIILGAISSLLAVKRYLRY